MQNLVFIQIEVLIYQTQLKKDLISVFIGGGKHYIQGRSNQKILKQSSGIFQIYKLNSIIKTL
jgi:hypothetical protein